MSQLSVLIIDDNRDEAECLRDSLLMEGHRVVMASDASEALDLLRQSQGHDEFHLVVLDLVMPHVSGLELLPQIRRIDNDVAVVILTGYPTVETAADAIHHEVSAYIKKPFSIEKFREVIERVARRKGLALNGEEALHLFIGRTIRDLRKKKGLTLKQTARRTNLSVSLLSQIERAESSASVSSLYKVATALDVKITDLFGDF
jgi:DNA-binding NtrC family response regulator